MKYAWKKNHKLILTNSSAIENWKSLLNGWVTGNIRKEINQTLKKNKDLKLSGSKARIIA